jgi:hypothetical protein
MCSTLGTFSDKQDAICHPAPLAAIDCYVFSDAGSVPAG